MHVTIAIVVPGFLALGWWQLTRALSGNSLSWAYVFEWPIFAGYAIYVWWKLIHEAPREEPAVSSESPGTPDLAGTRDVPADHHGDVQAVGQVGEVDEADEELAKYNEYLAALNASGRRKRW